MKRGGPVTPLIPVDASYCGPAMLALNPAQRAFVIGKVFFGLNNSQAARRAGYSTNGESLKVIAHSVVHHPGVQAALLEEGQKLMRSEGPKSILTLRKLRDDENVPARDRIKASVELLNRSGFHALTEHHLTVEHTMSETEKDRRILALCQELGVPNSEARKLLIAPGAIEADFEVVEPAAPLSEKEARKAAARARKNALERRRRKLTPEERKIEKAKTQAANSARRKQVYAAAKAARAAQAENNVEGEQ